MPFDLYDYVNAAGENVFAHWTRTLEKKERAKLASKIDMLSQHGSTLFPEILTNTPTPGVLKLRVKGGVQLRPMLCYGPVDIQREFTFLLGAKEVGGKFVPARADALAADNKAEVVIDPGERRRPHEHVR